MPEIDVLNLDERVKTALLALLESIEKEDEPTWLMHCQQYKRNNLFWHGFQYIFWSDIDNDWRIPTHEEFEELSSREEVHYMFDYVVNVFKAHGESIIAALSADIPDVRFGPRDAQDPDDYRAVEAADACVELIQKWNRAKLTIINSLFYLATEGFLASYTYNKKDPQFGQVQIPQYGTEMRQTSPDQFVCPNCGYSEQVEDISDQESDAPNPPVQAPTKVEGSDDTEAGEVENQPTKQCPMCMGGMAQEKGLEEEIPVLIGRKPIPKGREIIEVYGALNVRVPTYVPKQADAGWLVHYVDADPALFKDAFPDVKDEIGADSENSYDRSMRATSLTSEGTSPGIQLATEKKVWMRPWMINRLEKLDEDVEADLRQLFPKGIYCAFVGKTLCEARDESMDEHWTITKAGPSKGVHADPLLQSMVPLQEIHNNLVNLFVMQVEYGIPATYADTEVFDFQGQAQQEVSPGYVYPVTPRPGQSISDAFYSEKTTSLSKETTQLLSTIESLEQFVSGSFPSIYGGPSVSGSKTLGEYDKSRSFALQRLSLVWYFVNVWWGETIHKALLSFIEHQVEDEALTSKTAHGFQTKWIKRADFKGSFDRLEPDVSSDFPSSFAQKRAVIMQLLQLGNPTIEEFLFSPENADVVKAYVGFNELKIPMSEQRHKQMREIMELIGFAPQESIQGGLLSTVPVEAEIDDHDIHMEVLKNFLQGNVALDMRAENPQGYANCLAHYMEHKMVAQQMMMQQAAMGGSGGLTEPGGPPPPGPPGPPPPKPSGTNSKTNGVRG